MSTGPPGQLVRDRRARARVAGPGDLRRRPAPHHRGAGRGDRQHPEVPDLPEPVGGRLGRGGLAGDPARDHQARRGGRERQRDPGADRGTPTATRCSSSRPSSGFAGLVWILPVVAVVVALVALSAAFARWRRAPKRRPPTRTGPSSSRPSASGERSRLGLPGRPRGAARLPPSLPRGPRARARGGRCRRARLRVAEGRLHRPRGGRAPLAGGGPGPRCDGPSPPGGTSGRDRRGRAGLRRARRSPRGPGLGSS